MKLLILLYLILSVFIFNSCWVSCNPSVHAILIDNETLAPLDSIVYDVYDDGVFIETREGDNDGNIYGWGESESRFIFSSRCENEIEFHVRRDGYRDTTFTVSSDENDVTIRMIKDN